MFKPNKSKHVNSIFTVLSLKVKMQKHMVSPYLDFTKIHLLLNGVHLLCPLHPPRSIIAAGDQLLIILIIITTMT